MSSTPVLFYFISLAICFAVLVADEKIHSYEKREFLEKDLKADIVVAKDGTGDYSTVKEAIAAAPDNSPRKFVIYVKRGVYKETIFIGRKKKNLKLVGDGADSTLITGNLSNQSGSSTSASATIAAEGDGFMAQDLWIQNSAGPDYGQAVALRVKANTSVIYRCKIDGYQDTLYSQKNRQFYRDCFVTGTVDFIFGDATAVFQNCEIQARKPKTGQGNSLTAQSREDPSDPSGFSFQNCSITASPELGPIKATVKTYLGRPWRNHSRVVFLQSYIGDLIDPEGWARWDVGVSDLYYAEYNNRGPGADTSKRVNWKGYKVITDPNEAANFTVANLIGGLSWLNTTGVPYQGGL